MSDDATQGAPGSRQPPAEKHGPSRLPGKKSLAFSIDSIMGRGPSGPSHSSSPTPPTPSATPPSTGLAGVVERGVVRHVTGYQTTAPPSPASDFSDSNTHRSRRASSKLTVVTQSYHGQRSLPVNSCRASPQSIDLTSSTSPGYRNVSSRHSDQPTKSHSPASSTSPRRTPTQSNRCYDYPNKAPNMSLPYPSKESTTHAFVQYTRDMYAAGLHD
ncbi:unnamed protein product, partial [Lymnaea stagnalis]